MDDLRSYGAITRVKEVGGKWRRVWEPMSGEWLKKNHGCLQLYKGISILILNEHVMLIFVLSGRIWVYTGTWFLIDSYLLYYCCFTYEARRSRTKKKSRKYSRYHECLWCIDIKHLLKFYFHVYRRLDRHYCRRIVGQD